jgi:hypothetical protein
MLMPMLAAASELTYNRDIRPLLSENCFSCHGPDEKGRKADLRLDVSGADWKEVITRITSTDPDEVMPPPESHKKVLSATEIATLETWIQQGAQYQRHWAFEPLAYDPKDTIDSIVERSLQQRGHSLAKEAAPHELLRRVCLDLTGLPPQASQISYGESQIDSLLASPHFGEHMAVAWLDAARYADTNGYFGDKPRQMWLWRDWVIHAFNSNMPYDQFCIEQLAGDLLPNPTTAQRIAMGFNRNHMANNESGAIDEEYRVEYVVDRVDTTMTTFLGLTAGCAQCHDHKFDPISQREYYQLYAFFNNVPEKGLITEDNPAPTLEVPTAEQTHQLASAQDQVKQAQAAFAPIHDTLKPQIAEWEKSAKQTLPPSPENALLHESFTDVASHSKGNTIEQTTGVISQAAKFDGTQHWETSLHDLNPDAPWTIGFWINGEGPLSCPLSLIEPSGHRRGMEIIWQKGRIQVNLVHRWGASAIEVSSKETIPSRSWHHLAVSYDGSRKASGLSIFMDGVLAQLEVRLDSLSGTLKTTEPLRVGRRDINLGFYGALDELCILPRAVSSTIEWQRGERLRGILMQRSNQRSKADADVLLDDYIAHHGDHDAKAASLALRNAVKAAKTLRASIPTTLVMQEMPSPRKVHILERGQYDKPGEKVLPGVPTQVASWQSDLPGNRLGFSKWLFSPNNPLTARVAVNRLWAQCFGEGIVRTMNDFGSQGEAPTHPELLDWLAGEFVRTGWDVKALLKRIVMSRTYRQSSRITLDDPENRLLARGPSSRLSAETLRDQALALSGLLVPKIGGPSVKPFQPPGLWEAVSFNAEDSYVQDTGDNLWRRSLYTYIKRQSPHPMLLTFDGPTREKCTVRRARTNTPLQALLLLNDETFMRAAEALANRAKSQTEPIAWMFHRATSRQPSPDELSLLHDLYQRQKSLTLVAHTILNLDEVITKR